MGKMFLNSLACLSLLFRRDEIQYEIIKAWNNASGEIGIHGMINVHFVSQSMGIVRAEIAEAAKTVNVLSEILNKKNTRNLIWQKFNKKIRVAV